MGFFSYECEVCGHSIRSATSTRPKSAWMRNAVVRCKNGKQLAGEYDGYGCFVGGDKEAPLYDMEPFTIYHRVCWGIAGKPGFRSAARRAEDQGHFVGEYDPTKPKSIADCDALKAKVEVEPVTAEDKAAWMASIVRVVEALPTGKRG